MHGLNIEETGGPAFPQTHGQVQYYGMTLRDYFAAKAMQGLLADLGIRVERHELARRAYEIADAMLKARQQ